MLLELNWTVVAHPQLSSTLKRHYCRVLGDNGWILVMKEAVKIPQSSSPIKGCILRGASAKDYAFFSWQLKHEKVLVRVVRHRSIACLLLSWVACIIYWLANPISSVTKNLNCRPDYVSYCLAQRDRETLANWAFLFVVEKIILQQGKWAKLIWVWLKHGGSLSITA